MRNLRNTVQILNIIQLEDYIRNFLFSYRVFQDRLDRKKSQQTLLQLTVDLINKGNLRREFCINGIVCSSAIQFLSTTGKKTPKSRNPKPCFTQLHYWVPQEGKCQYLLLQFRLLFSNVPFSKGWVFLKFENLHFHTIFDNSSYLCKPEMISGLFSLRELHGKH